MKKNLVILFCLFPGLAFAKSYLFISFSMPEILIETYFREADKNDVVLVLKGINKEERLKTFLTKYILPMVKKYPNAIVEIDPERFRKYAIQVVPTFVIEKNGKYKKLSGAVSFSWAMEKLGSRY